MKFFNNTVTLVFGLCLVTILPLQAQYSLLKSADREFDTFNFVKAIELYQRAYDVKADIKTAERLAASYYHIRNYREAETWYARLANHDEAKIDHILQYGHVLRNNSKFREAKAQYQRVALKAEGAISREELAMLYASCDSAVVWLENPIKAVEVKNQKKWNSAQAEFGATKGPDGLYFASDRFDGAAQPDVIYGWTGNPYLSMYVAKEEAVHKVDAKWGDGANHFGPATFSKPKNEVYFAVTRNLTREEKRKAGKDVTVNIEIFSNSLDATDWGRDATPFRYNNITEWSVGDPFLTASGDTLYFTSDMSGGKGGTDIYYVVRQGDGAWGDAVNLGAAVNTPGDERFPAIDDQGDFYFSSDGHLGMGGLDVYRLSKSGTQAKAINLGFPFNSPYDDFSIRFDKELEGYVASNRSGGAGADDIYWFNLNKVVQIDLEGGVYNEKTKLPVSGAKVTLTPEGDELNAVVINAGTDGKFTFNLAENMDYTITAEQTGFREFTPLAFSTAAIDSSTTLQKDVYLSPVEVKEVVVLRNIYFDFDKADIRPDAALELDKIAAFLNSDPSVRIELSAHADSRGTAAYNMKLTQRRADSSVAYLVSKGIAADRLVAKGYGFTKLANHCAKGVECTEEEHQWNRRVEFFVIENGDAKD
ncbi:OmpA family protein [Parapedobacter indicus]|uniref:WD40-like Beta Propeller Repeat n=1 Tax=Parapedobacter indicus TaxID=1477437 RepID=A0A1I3S3W7_9SPHI|nr:OmpA family protein [Parapedobacter indicus]PPK99877.1 WD40 repeat protein [Parapedobacter indicus]SFJ53060.1 WD40-like Beta Propeller Repeat [Parapedobacter indicus]